jgi:hypothetical protein
MRTFVLNFQDGTQKDLAADRYSTINGEVYFFVGDKMSEHIKKDMLTMIDEKENDSVKADRTGASEG